MKYVKDFEMGALVAIALASGAWLAWNFSLIGVLIVAIALVLLVRRARELAAT